MDYRLTKDKLDPAIHVSHWKAPRSRWADGAYTYTACGLGRDDVDFMFTFPEGVIAHEGPPEAVCPKCLKLAKLYMLRLSLGQPVEGIR